MSAKNQTPLLKENARIGILNRGEAALRFIRAVKEYNALNGTSLKTVAFYIDKEEYAPFSKAADEALALSSLPEFPGQQASPYLDHDVMLSAVKTANCQAVWVGWGFVSEDAPFAEKIEQAGIVFMGPSAKAMALLGDKIAAKDLAETADVPILPWSKRSVVDYADAVKVSEEIGYPVIVKASNAGGGRGIRFVRTPDVLEAQFKSARDETIRITGNDIVFIEYLVEKGRHLEVQVLADSHGNVNTFGVRDCSVQRKNQKIIEETPPPNFKEEVIREMEASAARLIKAADYVGAGTVEYLYDLRSERFFFMEVNTRLQVEHPITETLYGIDLVKGQIDVAMGKVVNLSDRKPKGCVMEVRLNAEDPDRDFSPAPGLVDYFKAPAGPGIRVDSGIEQNTEIPSEFDSMVGKIIAHGNDRSETVARLKRALTEMRIRIHNGTTNRNFLLELLNNPDILAGGVHTGYVEELLKNKTSKVDAKRTEIALMAGAVEMYYQQHQEDFLNFCQHLSKTGRPRVIPKSEGYEVTLSTSGNSYTFAVRAVGNDTFHLQHEGKTLVCRFVRNDQEVTLITGGQRYNILMVPRGDSLQCEVDGSPVTLESESGGYVKAPSPAIVLSINAKIDAEVKKGDVLLVLEAMKMEMLVEAPADGVVKEICVTEGAQIAAGQPLVQLELGEEGEEETSDVVPPVEFSVAELDDGDNWEMLRRDLTALFLGFDTDKDPGSVLKELASFAKSHQSYQRQLVPVLLEILDAYTAVETLFTPKEMTADSLARPMTYPELLSHYFRRTEDKEKGLPEGFLNDLEKVFTCFTQGTMDDDEYHEFALYNTFKSHGKVALKQEILKQIFFLMEDLDVDKSFHTSFSMAIDRIVKLCQNSAPAVADAAIHARYSIVDGAKLNEIKKISYRAVDSLVKKLSADNLSEEDSQRVINAGPSILGELVRQASVADGKLKELILKLVALRQNRDRATENGRIIKSGNDVLYLVEGKTKKTPFQAVYVVATEDEYKTGLPLEQWIKDAGLGSDAEISILVNADSDPICQSFFKEVASFKPLPVKQVAIGVFRQKDSCFRTYATSNGWEELKDHHAFSPLQYRELRIARLGNFNLSVLSKSDGVFLLEATAKENPKDIRLFGFVDVAEAEPEAQFELDSDRLVIFETLLMELVYAMRAAQAKYRYRLMWNRIIVHNRTILKMNINDLQKYGQKLMPITRDLGLEKLVFYTRRKKWSEEAARELELDYVAVAEDQLSLRNRTPSDELLKPYDKYVTKAVRARQRNSVYPYEFIKMLTSASSANGETAYKGEFEEFDIEIAADGSQKPVSVDGREYGLNDGNIVFGIITNYDGAFPVPLKRVIILADPTGDLGSLAEPECRRVNAALDLAAERQLPVEWIPISSGAKINMDSGTENLDWTAATLRRIIEFTQDGGELNIIVPGINVGAQSYWNAEATMLMHTRGLLIMTDDGALLLTGKKALDFSGSVSGETNLDIGGVEKIMGPNGQAQIRVPNLTAAYSCLFNHYRNSYVPAGEVYPPKTESSDPADRDVSITPYNDFLGQGFETIGDIFSFEKNPERKKPFDIRQVMSALIDSDADYCERWRSMQDSDTAIIWETRMGGNAVGMIGIESRNLSRIGEVPYDGPESWSGGTLFPMSSKKVARGINAFSGHLPLVIVANLSGFDGSPESLRRLQLEYGAEIGRAVVNFKGPIAFVVVARYHGGAYVVFSKSLNPNLRAAALEGSYASVIGGAPAAAVVFPKAVLKETYADDRIVKAQEDYKSGKMSQKDFNTLFSKINNEKQTELGQKFDRIHSVKRAQEVGSIDDIITSRELRPYIIKVVEEGMDKYKNSL